MSRFLRFVPWVAYMILVCVLSHREPMLERLAGDSYFVGLDKCAHLIEFSILLVLAWWAMVGPWSEVALRWTSSWPTGRGSRWPRCSSIGCAEEPRPCR